MKLKKIVGAQSSRIQTYLILSFSAVIALGTFLYLHNYQKSLQRENALVPVYVANTEIPSGTSFEEMRSNQLIKIANLPKDAITQDALTNLNEIDGTLKSRGLLLSGQLILKSYFDADSRKDVSLKIPKGMLAIGLSVDDISRVGNFVLPGSRVAIFATGGNKSGSQSTRVLLSDALVLSIGNQTDIASNSITSSPLVTIAVNPRDAERVILSSQSMKISFGLAYNNDPRALVVPTTQATTSDLFS